MSVPCRRGSIMPKKENFNVTKGIEAVYRHMLKPSIRLDFEIPHSFKLFYNKELHVGFLKATMVYVYAHLHYLQFKSKSKTKWSVLAQADKALKDMNEAKQHMASCYSKIILYCSNFERQKEDECFFECIFYFVCTLVKLGVQPDQWVFLEDQLSTMFRTKEFNLNTKSHERDEYYDAVSLDAARHIYQWKGKQPVHKPMSVPKPNFMVDTTVHVASQTERCKVLAKKVNANLSISQKIQQRILSNRVSMAQHVKPKKDTKDLKRHIRGFAPKTNLRKAIHARSPVITTLLPTAMEELQISIEQKPKRRAKLYRALAK